MDSRPDAFAADEHDDSGQGLYCSPITLKCFKTHSAF